MKMRACLLMVLSTALWALAGCSDVESCLERSELGCLNSTPRPDGGGCLFGLVVVDGICQKSGTSNTKCGPCKAGSICNEKTNSCVDFCAKPTQNPGSVLPPESIFCEAIATTTTPNPAMLTFADVCQRRCRLNCQRLAQFCPGYQCPAGSCDGADVRTKCAMDCPGANGAATDLACLTRRCNDTRMVRCDNSLSCPNGVAPNCSNIACTNDCMFSGQDVTGDGVCDDGDVLSSETAQCDWGSDCTDCGPRQGNETFGDPGDICQYTLNCAGGTGSPDTAGAWCVNLNSVPGVARCMPDCSRGQSCADGFTCRQALFKQADGSNAQITAGGFSSSACLPDACL
jgi:hypothetical protein